MNLKLSGQSVNEITVTHRSDADQSSLHARTCTHTQERNVGYKDFSELTGCSWTKCSSEWSANADSGCGATGHCVLGALPLQMRIKSLNNTPPPPVCLSLCLMSDRKSTLSTQSQHTEIKMAFIYRTKSLLLAPPVLFEFLLWMTKDREFLSFFPSQMAC